MPSWVVTTLGLGGQGGGAPPPRGFLWLWGVGGGGSGKDHGLGECVRRGVKLTAPTGNEASPAPAPVVEEGEEGVLFLSALGALAEEGLVVRPGMAPARVPLADDV